MTKKKANASLHHPVSKTKWEEARAAERITYDKAQAPRISWRGTDAYKCPELHHRSMRNQPPSVVMGQRVERRA